MKKVIVNVPFKDRHTGKLLEADGKILEMTEDRVQEIKEVNPNFITVVGIVEEKKNAKADDKKANAKADDKKADK